MTKKHPRQTEETRPQRRKDCDGFMVGRPGNGHTLDWLTSLNVITNLGGRLSRRRWAAPPRHLHLSTFSREDGVRSKTKAAARCTPAAFGFLPDSLHLANFRKWLRPGCRKWTAYASFTSNQLGACWDEQHSSCFYFFIFPSQSQCFMLAVFQMSKKNVFELQKTCPVALT